LTAGVGSLRHQPRLAVVPRDDADNAAALALADRLALPVVPAGRDPRQCTDVDALLQVSGDGLCLQMTGRRAPGPVAVDFGSGAMRHRRRAGANELLGRAVGVGRVAPLRVMDATAGLGRDAFVLADLGCEVLMVERHAVIFELLHSGLTRAAAAPDPWLRDVAARMRLVQADARDLSSRETDAAEVIYLDPMFPPRAKAAAANKSMTLFQFLLGEDAADTEIQQLWHWARRCDVARVVVKRPLRAPALEQPSHCIAGKAVRYDVYVLRAWH